VVVQTHGAMGSTSPISTSSPPAVDGTDKPSGGSISTTCRIPCYARYREGFVTNIQKGDVPSHYQSLTT